MKNSIALALALLTTSFSAEAGIRENGGFIVPAAAEIELYNPGNGIDEDLKDAVTLLIQEYQQAGYVKKLTSKSVGFEGAVILCVELNELEASRRLNQQLIELLQSGQKKANLKFIPSCDPQPVNGIFRRK